VSDIFESKVKMLQAIIEWSIKHGVSFTLLKINKSYYTTVCAFIKERDIVCRNVCPWKLHASVPKCSCGYFKIKFYIGEHTCSQPSLPSNHHKSTTSFVWNVIMSLVRNKHDLTLVYIIDYIGGTYHINITYNMT